MGKGQSNTRNAPAINKKTSVWTFFYFFMSASIFSGVATSNTIAVP